MGRTNKARLAVCSKAIVKQECLVFVFLAVWMVTTKHFCWGKSNSNWLLFPVCLSDLVTSRPRSAIVFDCLLFSLCYVTIVNKFVKNVMIA